MNRREQPPTMSEHAISTTPDNVATHVPSTIRTNEPSRISPQSSNGPGYSIELHIDELVLHGFNPADRYRIGDAVERELTRLFTELGANDAIAQRDELALMFEVRSDSSSKAIGTELAKAIYGGLNR